MSIIGEATGVLGLLGKAWSWVTSRVDPARGQAHRLIEAFEAYGIVRQLISRAVLVELRPTCSATKRRTL